MPSQSFEFFDLAMFQAMIESGGATDFGGLLRRRDVPISLLECAIIVKLKLLRTKMRNVEY